MSSQAEGNQQVKKKNKNKLLIIGIVLVALAGSVYGYLNYGPKNTAEQAACKDTKSVTLPSITANLIDNGYFKTTITLEYISSKKLDKELNGKLYKVKDSVLEVLRNTNTASLKNPEETDALKEKLLKEINKKLVWGEVTGLFFEEFIVQ